MTWLDCVLVALAVCGWTVAAGLYLQLKEVLGLCRDYKTRAEANLHLAEFAVKALDHEIPERDAALAEFWRQASTPKFRVVDDA